MEPKKRKLSLGTTRSLRSGVFLFCSSGGTTSGDFFLGFFGFLWPEESDFGTSTKTEKRPHKISDLAEFEMCNKVKVCTALSTRALAIQCVCVGAGGGGGGRGRVWEYYPFSGGGGGVVWQGNVNMPMPSDNMTSKTSMVRRCQTSVDSKNKLCAH